MPRNSKSLQMILDYLKWETKYLRKERKRIADKYPALLKNKNRKNKS